MTVPFSPPKPPGPLVISGRDVTAVLGPTNTGKTHLAIERMLTHRTGVIGLPLRLLAREVYTRVCEKVGAERVSLITGEEKITPRFARYSVHRRGHAARERCGFCRHRRGAGGGRP
jgi:ATP-dependent RNA helicase SUPV3L1/SUV3